MLRRASGRPRAWPARRAWRLWRVGLDERERTTATPARLEEVGGRIERRRGRTGEHRPKMAGQSGKAQLELERELIGHRGPIVAGGPGRRSNAPDAARHRRPEVS